MSITIIKAGVYDTIQDLGRYGYARDGVNPSGVMDVLAYKVANSLAGNELNMPVIEMHFPASIIRFNASMVVGISGADFSAMITSRNGNRTLFPVNKSAYIEAGSVISFSKKVAGERSYLAIHGGMQLNAWLGSVSTNSTIGQGGFQGRRLHANDEILLNKKQEYDRSNDTVFPWKADVQSWYESNIVNVLLGPEWDWLQPTSKKKFLSTPFTVLAQSDRMGMQLKGSVLQRLNTEELVSSGVTFGTIQLLPNGNVIVLMADRAITGGYPRIANIIDAHLPKLAQSSTGSQIVMALTDLAKSEDLLVSQFNEIQKIKSAVKMKFLAFNLA
jgi:antagonist of KipI